MRGSCVVFYIEILAFLAARLCSSIGGALVTLFLIAVYTRSNDTKLFIFLCYTRWAM